MGAADANSVDAQTFNAATTTTKQQFWLVITQGWEDSYDSGKKAVRFEMDETGEVKRHPKPEHTRSEVGVGAVDWN